MNEEYARALILAKNLILRHARVEYNNSTQLRMADQWFNDIIASAISDGPIPDRPKFLTDNPE